ncbi:MAG: molecular chaperone HtpG [Pseudomonadota bacterium]
MAEEKLSFQAEVSRLLDIVANSLYSNKEIFLRELISNASDACDRLRYAALTAPELIAENGDFRITLQVDAKARLLTVADNGIGMNHDELIENLGTIARSGTSAFVEQLEEAADNPSLIGQFGVGFYSGFMVADRVEVLTRKAGEQEGWKWASDGKGEFAVTESDEAPAQGTKVTLHLKKGEEEYLDEARLRRIVTTYSDHIAFPVMLLETGKENGELEERRLNSAGAIWTRPKSEITDEQYKEFYHHVGQGFDDPWMRLHFRVEGVMEYTGLLFVPSAKPFDLFDPTRRHHVKLYVKRVFITDDCAELLPSYMRFLRGVIDTEDLPLNVSRELLQRDPKLTKIRNGVVKRVLGELKKKAEKTPDDYGAFWENFGAVLKEGLYEDEAQREKLMELARFRTTETEGWSSLADYIGRMKDGQEAIYTISGDKLEALKKSPQLEGFRAKGVEVLLLTDPVDEFWMPTVGTYQEKPFKSVTRAGTDLGEIKGEAGEESTEDDKEAAPEGVDALVAYVKLTLKDQVKDVRASERLTESPVCLVADETGMDMHLERILKQHNQLEQAGQRILEINPKHPLIRSMAGHVGASGAGNDLESLAYLLLDQARILEGEPLPDPVDFNRRLSELVAKGLSA